MVYYVVSLFDGISCGQLALRWLKRYDVMYFASEIDAKAIAVTQSNFPNTVQLGDVRTVKYDPVTGTLTSERGTWSLPRVDLLLAGTPCQDLANCNGKGRKRKGLDGPTSSLYHEFVRILKETTPTHFLMENVVMRGPVKHCDDEITAELGALGARRIEADSKRWCAQSRPRLYWTTSPWDGCMTRHPFATTMRELIGPSYVGIMQLEARKQAAPFQPGQVHAHTLNVSRPLNTQHVRERIDGADVDRPFTVWEAEQLQTVPHDYTREGGSIRQRVQLLGNGWTVVVIADLLREAVKPGMSSVDTCISEAREARLSLTSFVRPCAVCEEYTESNQFTTGIICEQCDLVVCETCARHCFEYVCPSCGNDFERVRAGRPTGGPR